MLDAIDGLNAFQHVLNGGMEGILSRFQGQALMAHILKRHDFRHDFLLGELFPWDGLVLEVIGTVNTAVDAVVGQVKGRKHDNPVPVEPFLDLCR